MHIAGYILLGCFVVSSIIHLFFCFKENEFGRRVSKPFCLFCLSTGVAFLLPSYPLVYIAGYCSLLGDVFFLKKKETLFFVLGSTFFIGGHVCLFAQLIMSLSVEFPIYWYFILLGILVVSSLVLFPIVKPAIHTKGIFLGFYFAILLILVAFGIVLAIDKAPKCWPGLCIALGYVFFFMSDLTIVLTLFYKDIKRRDFYIMILYLIAEALIMAGFILLLI